MSTGSEVIGTSVPVESAGQRRRWAIVAAMAAVLLAGALAAFVALHQDGRYGPIRSGQFAGIYSAQDLVQRSDGLPDHLAGGPDATTQLLDSLDNAGAHSVTVTAIETDDVVTEVRWSELHTVPGGFISGTDTPWRNFPAVIPAHATIRLRITIHRPTYCGPDSARFRGARPSTQVPTECTGIPCCIAISRRSTIGSRTSGSADRARGFHADSGEWP